MDKETTILKKLNILFLCTGNSCRSQMAEGWAKALKGNIINVFSAGIELKELDKRAVKVMAESGIDISKQYPKSVDTFKGISFDYVITVCDDAHENCPIFPGKVKIIHHGFSDPPRIIKESDTEDEKLDKYRQVRDEIKIFIESLPEILETK